MMNELRGRAVIVWVPDGLTAELRQRPNTARRLFGQ